MIIGVHTNDYPYRRNQLADEDKTICYIVIRQLDDDYFITEEDTKIKIGSKWLYAANPYEDSIYKNTKEEIERYHLNPSSCEYTIGHIGWLYSYKNLRDAIERGKEVNKKFLSDLPKENQMVVARCIVPRDIPYCCGIAQNIGKEMILSKCLYIDSINPINPRKDYE